MMLAASILCISCRRDSFSDFDILCGFCLIGRALPVSIWCFTLIFESLQNCGGAKRSQYDFKNSLPVTICSGVQSQFCEKSNLSMVSKISLLHFFSSSLRSE